MREKKNSYWAFTVNNYTENILKDLKEEDFLKKHGISYILFGEETAPTTGTKHLQGFIHVEHGTSFKYLKDNFHNSFHWEVCRSNFANNKDYCSKGLNVFEWGTPKCNNGKRNDLSEIKQKILNGKSIHDILPDITNLQQLKFAETLYKYSSTPNPRFDLKVYWYWGETGSAMTGTAVAFCMKHHPNDWWISSNTSKFFNGYWGQTAVILDSINEYNTPIDFLLKLIDPYPLTVETKGGFCYFNAHLIFITCRNEPKKYISIGDSHSTEILRRCTLLKHFLNKKKDIIGALHKNLNEIDV